MNDGRPHIYTSVAFWAFIGVAVLVSFTLVASWKLLLLIIAAVVLGLAIIPVRGK